MEVVVSESERTDRTRALILAARDYEDEAMLTRITKAMDDGIHIVITEEADDRNIIADFYLGGREHGEGEDGIL